MNTAELVKEAKKEATEETQVRYLKRTIELLRLSDNDEQILQKLVKAYSSDFTKEELRQIMKQTK